LGGGAVALHDIIASLIGKFTIRVIAEAAFASRSSWLNMTPSSVVDRRHLYQDIDTQISVQNLAFTENTYAAPFARSPFGGPDMLRRAAAQGRIPEAA
jgi:hypothetical protein